MKVKYFSRIVFFSALRSGAGVPSSSRHQILTLGRVRRRVFYLELGHCLRVAAPVQPGTGEGRRPPDGGRRVARRFGRRATLGAVAVWGRLTGGVLGAGEGAILAVESL